LSIFDTATAFARFVGVSPSAIYNGKKAGRVRTTEDGKFDTDDSVNRRYIMAVSTQMRRQRGVFIDPVSEDSPEKETSLSKEHQRAKISLDVERTINLKLKNAALRKDLIPADIAQLFVGAFSSGIRTNFLQLGTRVARGNTALRDKIEKEVKKAIQKTLDNAAAQLREIAESAIEITDDEDAV
jgi:hypothetical protein